MKKSILFIALAVGVMFTSCSKDDGDDKNCESCTLEGVSVKACDNGDGTVTTTSNGESDTLSEEDLGGLSAAAYVSLIKAACTAN